MDNAAGTWHHGLVAAWWAAFNDDFRPHEVEYYRAAVDRLGGPVLDAGCGTGRVMIPLLRDGHVVDGCDVSADMIDVCRAKASAAGFTPMLSVQALDEIQTGRRYPTIIVCGVFGLGSTRERDLAALRRLRALLEPGGTLLVDVEMPYADQGHWGYWPTLRRASLPETLETPQRRRRASDGSEFAMSSRIVALDPLEQRVDMEIAMERWRDADLEAQETHRLTIGMYFKNEMLMMLERAGFTTIELHGEHEVRPPTGDDEFVVFVASG
jgi:SAM-dependent methyltransferase